jgi:hypothetical protein
MELVVIEIDEEFTGPEKRDELDPILCPAFPLLGD